MADWLDGGVPADLVINEGATASVDTSVYYSSPSSLKLVEGLYSNYWPTGCLITLPSLSTAISVSLRVRCDSATDLFVEAYWTGGYARHYSASTGTSGSWVLVEFTIPAHTPTDPILVAVSAENAPDQAVLYIDSVTYSGQTGSWLDGGVVPANVEAFGPVSVDTTVFHSSPSSLKLLGEAGFVGSGFGGGFQLVIPQGSAPTPVSLRLRCDDDAEISVYSSNALNDGEEFYTDTATSGWVAVSFTVETPTVGDGYVEVVAYGYDAPATLYVDDWSAALVPPAFSGAAPGVAPEGGVGLGTVTFTEAEFGLAPSVEPSGGVGAGEVRYYFRALGTYSGGGVGRGDLKRPIVGEAPGVSESCVGLAYSIRTTLGLRNLFAYAPGFKSGGVGAATADLPLTGVAQGIAPTGGVGAAFALATHFAVGVNSSASVGLGQARLASRFSAPAVEPTTGVGVARADLHFFAPGVYRPTRFGAAYLTLGWAFVAPSVVMTGRVGAGSARFNVRNIPGVAPTTEVGLAVFSQGHRAPHIPPSTGAGRGQLTRTPSC